MKHEPARHANPVNAGTRSGGRQGRCWQRPAFGDFGPYADAVQERDDHPTAVATDKGSGMTAINGPLVSRTLKRSHANFPNVLRSRCAMT